jgi:integrase
MKAIETRAGTLGTSKYLSDPELKKILYFVKKNADHARTNGSTRAIVDELLILILLETGLKPKEFCKLRIQDLVIINSVSYLYISSDVNCTSGRKIKLAPEACECLQRFIRLYRKNASPDTPIFINERGNRFNYVSIYSKVKKIGQKVGLDKLHPQMLRDTFIVKLYDTERDLRLVQEQSGHSSIKTTAKYLKNIRCQRQSAKTESTQLPRLANDHSLNKPTTITCQACDISITVNQGTVIDSGQILCMDCINLFRA